MKILYWQSMSAAQRAQSLQRPAQRDTAAVAAAALSIIDAVRSGGDAALIELTEQFDGIRLRTLAVSAEEFARADQALNAEEHAAIEHAISTVRLFHAAQKPTPLRVETAPGVICERISVPVQAVGLYVPAGSAPLPSTAIMLAVPASIAQCPVRIMCTPPAADGGAHAAVLVAARKAGIDTVFKVGGAQAIAAMAYGTTSIPKCDKLFGPGNAWVTAAKLLVAQDSGGAAVDLPAGVTEVMVLADETARADFIAADLLAQAEHSPQAQAILVTTSATMAEATRQEVNRQIEILSRRDILLHSRLSIRLVVVENLEQAFDIANEYAPEHLLLQIGDPRSSVPRVTAAGAVFLGNWSPESTGDYCSGPNHTLPTYGYAKSHSGLCLEDFQKRITVQELSPAGLRALSGTARTLARLEGLDGHAAAVTVRLAALEHDRANA